MIVEEEILEDVLVEIDQVTVFLEGACTGDCCEVAFGGDWVRIFSMMQPFFASVPFKEFPLPKAVIPLCSF